MVYFYRQVSMSMATQVVEVAQLSVMIPPRADEEDQVGEEVVCDTCFLEAIKIALAETANLSTNVLQICENEWSRVDVRKKTKVNKQIL